MKKSLKIIVVLMIVLALLVPYTVSYGTGDDTDFFEVTSEEISTSDVIEGTLNIGNVSYDKFIFSLESSSDISEIEIVEDGENNEDTDIPEITVESENKITFEFDKTESDLTQIILQCSLPENIVSGDTITLVATVTNSENEEESESIEITINVVDESGSSTESSDETIENSEFSVSNEFSISGNSSFDMNTYSSDFSSMSSDSSFSSASNSMDSSSASSYSVDFSSTLTEETATYNGSDDCYLSELSVTSYELNKNFSKENTTYFITVDSSVDSIEINATAEDDGATVCIYGNNSLVTGENKILITVTAENGNARTYRVYVTKN